MTVLQLTYNGNPLSSSLNGHEGVEVSLDRPGSILEIIIDVQVSNSGEEDAIRLKIGGNESNYLSVLRFTEHTATVRTSPRIGAMVIAPLFKGSSRVLARCTLSIGQRDEKLLVGQSAISRSGSIDTYLAAGTFTPQLSSVDKFEIFTIIRAPMTGTAVIRPVD